MNKNMNSVVENSIVVVDLEPSLAFEDGIPRVRDLDLARFLEMKELHNIRDLISRKKDALGDLVTFTETHNGGPGRPGTAHWLTRDQALYITTQSGTKKAVSMTKKIIDVFLRALDGKLRDSEDLEMQHYNDPIIMLRLEQLKQNSRLEALEAKVNALPQLLAPTPVVEKKVARNALVELPKKPRPAAVEPPVVYEELKPIWMHLSDLGLINKYNTGARGAIGSIATRLAEASNIRISANGSKTYGKVNSYPFSLVALALAIDEYEKNNKRS